MKKTRVDVKKAVVMHRVKMATAWQGVKDEEAATRYERVAVVDADLPILENYWREGCAMVCQRLREWLGGEGIFHVDRDGCNSVLQMPDNWDDTQKGALRQRMEDYLTAMVLARWMAMTWQERQGMYDEQARQALDDVEKILWSRKRRPACAFRVVAKNNDQTEEKEES